MKYLHLFAIVLPLSEWDSDPWLETFGWRAGHYFRIGVGGRWGCVGFEVTRPPRRKR